VTAAEAGEVALCYGWMDSQRKSLDGPYFLQKYSLARHTRRASLPWSARPRGRPAVSQRSCRCSAGVLPWPAAGGLASIVRIDRPSAQLGQEHAFLSGDTNGAEPGHPAMLAGVKANSLAPPLTAFFNK
jgi:hypothetical protein